MENRTINLKQELYIDPTIEIASFKTNKIHVNPKFFKLPIVEQKVIVYHEKFHESCLGKY